MPIGGGFISLPTLVQRISIDTSEVDKAAASIGGKFGAVLPGLAKVGAGMTKFITLPLIGIGLAATKLATDFELAFSRIEGLVGVPREQLEQMKDAVLDLSVATGQGPRELADALYFVTSAGLAGSNAMQVLEASAKASASGLGETGVIADALTSALNAYGPATLSAAQATDILVAAVREGKVEADQLAPVLGNLLPTAAALGISFADVAGTLAVLSKTGTNAAEGATQVNAVFSALLDTSPKVRDALASVGLTTAQLRDVAGEDGLVAVMRLLDDAFEGNVEALRQVFPNVRAFRGVMNALAQDASGVDNVLDNVANSTGALDKAFNAVEKTARFKLDQAMASVQATLIEIGGAIAPVVAGFAKFGAAVFGIFTKLPAPLQNFITLLGGILAVLGPGILLVARFATAWTRVRTALAGTRLADAAANLLGVQRSAGGAARGLGLLGTSLTGLGVLAAIQGLIELTSWIQRTQRAAEEAAAERFAGIVLSPDEAQSAEDSIKQVIGEIEALGEAKTEAAAAGGEDFPVDVEGVEAAIAATAEKLRALREEPVGGISFGADKPTVELQKGFRGLIALTESQRIANEALEGSYDALEPSQEAVREALSRMGIETDKNTDLTLAMADAAHAFTPAGRELIQTSEGMIREAIEAGISYEDLATAIFLLGTKGRPGVDFLKAAVDELKNTRAGADDTTSALEGMAGKFQLAEEEVDGFNERLKESTAIVQETFESIVGLQDLAESATVGLGNVVARRSTEAAADAADAIADAEDRLADARDRLRTESVRVTPRRDERAIAAAKRDVEAATRDIAAAQRKAGEQAAEETTKGFRALLSGNVDFMRQFFADLEAIASSGNILLAQTIAEMGPEGAKIARDAAKKIGSGEGLGALEGELVEAILLSKRGMDATFKKFKPNIEEVVGDNIADPLQDNLDVIKGRLADGLDVGGLVDIFVAEMQRLNENLPSDKQVDPKFLANLAEIAATAKDDRVAIELLQVALDTLSGSRTGPVLELDDEDFDHDYGDALKRLNDLGLLTTIAKLEADPTPANRELEELLRKLTGISEGDWEAVVKAITDGSIPEVEEALDHAARDRTSTIKVFTDATSFWDFVERLSNQTGLPISTTIEVSHAGGLVGRGARRSPWLGLSSDEVPLIARRGEYMFDDVSVRNIGLANLQALHRRARRMHEGGLVGGDGSAMSPGSWAVVNLNFNGPFYGGDAAKRQLAEDIDRELSRIARGA